MAIRKKTTDSKPKSAANGAMRKFNFLRKFLIPVLCFLLGGVVFNLDRSGNLGVTLLKYKSFVPYPFSRMLPGAGSVDGAAVPEQIIEGRIIEVYDGDTATLYKESDNTKFKVRFFGIDAPEAAQQHGISSRDALREKILGKDVTVKVVSIDPYGRSVARVMLGARYVNLEMVTEGHAWYYADYARNEYDLAAGEKEARLRQRGLWRIKNPQPPWEYRRSKK